MTQKKSPAQEAGLDHSSRLNLTLAGCSSAEPASVSVQQCKIQFSNLYLQPVKILSHLPAEESSLFVMNKIGTRIEKTTKDKALKILTAGVPSFSINYENRRQIFVESKYDVFFYDKVYDKLRTKLLNEVSLNFISSGVGGAGNCDQVIEIVEKLSGYGNKFIFGIIDWDSKINQTAL